MKSIVRNLFAAGVLFASLQGAQAADVTLRAYNVIGQEVATLMQGRMEAGEHTMLWNAKNAKSALPTGVYFLRLDALNRSSLQKIILLK